MTDTKQLKPIHLYPYQARALLCLYEKPYLILDLNRDSKQQHSPNVVKYLRENGIDVISDYIRNENNPSSNRKVVQYSIHPESRPLALASLTAYKPNLKKLDKEA